jgi:hypothetical protein
MKKRLIRIYVTFSLFAMATISLFVYMLVNYSVGYIRQKTLARDIYEVNYFYPLLITKLKLRALVETSLL